MNEDERDPKEIEARLRQSDERLRRAEEASGVGTFELDLASARWEWTSQVAVLFGFDPRGPELSFEDLQRSIFADDVPKVRAAIVVKMPGGGVSVAQPAWSRAMRHQLGAADCRRRFSAVGVAGHRCCPILLSTDC